MAILRPFNSLLRTDTPPLHLEVRDAGTAQFLISAGASIHAKSNWGNTPLHEAALAGAIETVKILMRAGADAEAQDEFGDTPLDIAERNGQTEIEEYLFQLGQCRLGIPAHSDTAQF